ncbi:Lipoprotein YaeC [Burkholderia cenocepacia PC184]|nr:Lipoprotein YaeC [Burkholderia cenocepacia PC184]
MVDRVRGPMPRSVLQQLTRDKRTPHATFDPDRPRRTRRRAGIRRARRARRLPNAEDRHDERPRRANLDRSDEGRRARRPRDQGHRIQRLRAAERGARCGRPRCERLPAPAVPRQPDQAARLQDRQRRADLYGTDGLLFEEDQVAEGSAGRRESRDPERSVERQPRAAAAAEIRRDQAEAGRRRERRERDAARHRREPEEDQDRRARFRAVAARTARCRRRVDQHRLRGEGRTHAGEGCDRDRGSARPVREPDRGARAGQGQAVGEEARRGL